VDFTTKIVVCFTHGCFFRGGLTFSTRVVRLQLCMRVRHAKARALRSIAVKSAGSLQSMRYGAHKELQHH